MNRVKNKLKITISYNKSVAKRFHKKEYYSAMAADIKFLPNKEREKQKFAARKERAVSDRIEFFKTADYTSAWKVLLGIFKSRQKMAKGFMPHKKAGQIMSIMTNINFLATCYKNIKGKKGATTQATVMPQKQQKTRKADQKTFLKKTSHAPDGISEGTLKITSQLLKMGRYPWGISRRVYIPKPGTTKTLRPVTIPPFMDKVIQEGIRRILESIYEPMFEKMNRSFGFRPNKGVHDAIYGISQRKNWGLNRAIEGDIKAAYDKVNRKKLLHVLAEEIEDHQFLKLIRKRLQYTFFDTSTRKFITEREGIPQGGIDSPYLWNIYMSKFDLFVKQYMDNLLDKKNKKLKTGIYQEKATGEQKKFDGRNRNFTDVYERGRVLKRSLIKKVKNLKTGDINEREWSNINKQVGLDKRSPKTLERVKLAKYAIIKQVRLLRHNLNKQATLTPKRYNLRYYYTRYADDWIIMGNFGQEMAETIKKDIKNHLETELYATLSVEKTLITNMKKEPAKFLGFEFYVRSTYKINKILRKCPDGSQRLIISRINNTRIVVRPDLQRMINKAYMKRFCNIKGQPQSIPWLSCLETYAIIERFNACIRGLTNYYAEWITDKSTLNRWLYILKYSCLKTLAQKYSCSIKQIFKRFGVKTATQDTIEYKVTLNFKAKGEMFKKWRLITAREAIDKSLALNRKEVIGNIYDNAEGSITVNYQYPTKDGRIPRVMDKDFLEKINWVTRRAMASLGLPCTLCGEIEGVEIHHIKHIRKTPYVKIHESQPWLKLLSLKNRKQIPVCFECHRMKIHRGFYSGPRLVNMAPVMVDTGKGMKIYDGRQINIENFVKPGEQYGAKTLEEKGWTSTKENI